MSVKKTLLEVQNLSKTFEDPSVFFRHRQFYALKNISFTLSPRKTLAVIGRNGSGKSTLAKVLVGLMPPNEGEIFFKGTKLHYEDYAFRSLHIRMLFQNTEELFNPRLTVGQILDTPLITLTNCSLEERNEKIAESLILVGLYPDHANLRINSLSSSQKQRIALARALILKPDILIIDDALANLDTTVKIQIMNLLLKLQKRLGISYLYIGQHLGIIKHIADDVMVMEDGEIIEQGSAREVFSNPQMNITKRLLESEFGGALPLEAWQD